MYRRKGPYAILQDQKVELNFWSEFIAILADPRLSVIFVIINKKKAKQKGWQQKTILEKTYTKMLDAFAIKQLKQGISGKIIVESDPSQDLYLIAAHNRMQNIGASNNIMTGKEYREKLTSLSLVNKRNLDIDVQIADALAPIAGMMYSYNILQKQRQMNNIERMKENLIKEKLGNTVNPSIFEVLI